MKKPTTKTTTTPASKTTTTSTTSTSSLTRRSGMLSTVDEHGFVINDVPCERHNSYVPDPHDCGIVYLCVKNSAFDRKIKFSCPTGKYWNNGRMQCDWTCDRGNGDAAASSSSSSSSSASSTTSSTADSNGQALAYDCPPGSEAYFPHLTDCSKFFHCHDGLPREKRCPAGLRWNQDKRECDWTCNQGPYAVRGALRTNGAGEADGGIGGYSTTSTTSGNGQRRRPPTTSPSSSASSSSSSASKTSIFCRTEGTHHPDPLDCSVFYLCANNKLFRFECGWGFWNHTKRACDRGCDAKGYDDDADRDGVAADQLLRLSITHLKDDEAVSYLASNDDVDAALGSRGFFGKLVNRGGSSAGGVGDVGGGARGGGVDASDRHQSEVNRRVERIVDLHGNRILDLHGPVANVVGGNYIGGGGGGGSSGGNGGGLAASTALSPRTGRVCGAPNKFYSEPLDCSVFYICTHGKLVRFLCPGGSVWNQRKSVCDWECDNFD